MSENISSNMKSVLILARHKNLKSILTPALNIERDSINWDFFNYHSQSGGVQTVLSWVYSLFCDELPPKAWNFRDPFDGFFSLDRDIQVLIFEALAIRHGFVSLSLEDRPKSHIQQIVEDFGAQMEKEEKRKGLKIIKDDE